MSKRSIDFYPLFFGLLLCLFYPELLFVKAGPLVADHWEQHYPWAYLLASSLRQGIIPFWTSTMQCGFPLAAESQIGIFYLPNLVFSLLLPVHAAYSYTVLLHYLFSGLMCYAYTRTFGLKRQGALFAACAFVFGTGYGGAYYNITSLKTISWLPLMLLCVEKVILRPQLKWGFLFALSIGMCLVAGYLQVASLTLLFLLIYAIIRSISLLKENFGFKAWLARFAFLGGFSAAGILIALPQILMTFQLAVLSNRTGAELEYAYVGSLSPFAFLTMVFPIVQSLFRGNCLYLGILSVFLLMFTFFIKKDEQKERLFFFTWLFMLILACLLALGRWSPLYVALIETTKFSSFRTPAKFLIYINLAYAFLAGLGADLLLKSVKSHDLDRAAAGTRKTGLALIILCVFFAGSFFLLKFCRSWFEELGRFLLESLVHGKAGHPHSMETYLQKLQGYLDFAIELLNPFSFWFIWAVGLILINIFLLYRFLSGGRRIYLGLLFVLFMTDLFVFSLKDMKTDFAPYAVIEKESAAVQKLKALQTSGEVGRLYGYRSPDQTLSLIPSSNMLYGIDDIGGYSPLIMKRYHESIGLFGNVNDSNLSHRPSPEFVYERFPLLESLGVTHVLAAEALKHPKLELLLDAKTGDTREFLYRLRGKPEQFFWVNNAEQIQDWPALRDFLMAPGFDPKSLLLLESPVDSADHEDVQNIRHARKHAVNAQHMVYDLESSAPAYFVMMRSFFTGWRAFLNDQEIPILKAYGLFQAVHIKQAGKHRLELKFDPVRALTNRGNDHD